MADVVYGAIPLADPARYGLTLTRDVPYQPTGRRAHRLDVYRPKEGGPTPAVMYVHGGAFSMLSKDTHRVMALSIASRGYTVFNINYRLGPKHTFPAPLEDAAAALAWVHEHAREWGADPARIVIGGESAGGNLVTALAYMATHPRPEPYARALFDRAITLRGVAAIYGMLDLIDLDRHLEHPKLSPWLKAEVLHAARSYVGRPIALKAALAPLASPLRLLAHPPPEGARPLPPFFIAVGTADPLLDDSRRLHAVLQARGVPSELSLHPGEIHGFDALVWRREARAKWRALHDFLERRA